ncbi:MAG: hypothetical protein COA97_05930 [Flavobacteriales bacterium]|nr:MAG: hypothetical protein COA97_05930 [Flavobacteriales bacterium]
MKNKMMIITMSSMLVVSGLIYSFSSTNNCPLEGTPDCPKINCPLAGTPDCPYDKESKDLPDCCRK